MLCHSVFSWRSPEALSFQTSDVAIENRQNGVPLAVYFSSGSFPSRPTRITLFTEFAMQLLNLPRPLPCRCPRPLSVKFFELQLCRACFARARKFLCDFIQRLGCQRLVCFGEGKAFLQEGGPNFVVIGNLLQDKIVLGEREFVFFLSGQCVADSEMRVCSTRIVRVLR